MSVFLTGGAGYIGSHIAALLLEVGRDVIIADDFSNSSPDVESRLKQITGKNAVVLELNLNDMAALDAAFSSHSIDSVVHLAGFKAVGESVLEPLRYYRNNIISTINLLDVMSAHGVGHLIFSSSATVYGTPERLPLTEDIPAGVCSSPYGCTKQIIERIIKDAAVSQSSLSAVLLRYFNPIGAHPSGLLGERPSGIPNNLMPFITQVAKGTLPGLRVFGNDYPTGDGTCVRDYVHVMDLARGHVSALKYCAGRTGVEVMNLGTGKGHSVLEIIHAFERVNGIKIPYNIAPRREGDLPEYYADASKSERLMGWRAEMTIDDMCRDAWNWEKRL